ncbi:MAG TPA: Fe-S-containing protein [Candidatus Eisenbacteria bacterium]|nr:Fe-S-containing protein [Candidatus Eisenbacteria bacterium]
MFESLVIVTREGVEAALVVAIVIAYLRRSGQERLAPWVYGGVATAIVLSVIAAFSVPNINTVSETVEAWALLAGAVCVISLVLWMQHAGKSMKKEIESGLSRFQGGSSGAAGWGVFLFAALLVAREGLETVLFLVAISFNTAGLARLLGAVLGLAVAGTFGYLLLRGTVRVDLKRFFAVTTTILIVLAAQLVVGAYHEFAEAGYLPASKTSMALVGPLVRYDSLVFAVAVLLVLFLVGKRGAARASEPAAPAEENPAERRRRMAREQRERWARRATAVAATTVILILATGFLTQAQIPAQAEGAPVTLQEGTVLLPTAALGDGHAHFYRADLDGHGVRFFAIKRPAGDYVTCFDACEICGDKGYYEETGGMTCRNCTAPINLATLGRTGGCNPVPLASSVEGANLIIRQAELAKGEKRFAAMK